MSKPSSSQAAEASPFKPQIKGYRSKHRQQEHEDAHAHAKDAPPLPAIDHPLVTNDVAQWVDEQAILDDLVEILRQSGLFAYDTEFIGEATFYSKLCLVQVATNGDIWLIDPMAGLDLTGFWQLVADPAIEKVLHAAVQDLEPVYRHLGELPRNVFDTQIAAGMVGLDYPISLTRLAEELLGASLNAGAKFSQWDRRPLTKMQRRYAADDVRYLLAMREALHERLDSCPGGSRGPWCAAECEKFEEASLYVFEPLTQRLKGVRKNRMSKPQRAVLDKLMLWRAEVAEAHDVPTRTVLKDDLLAELATKPVKSVQELRQRKHIPKAVKDGYGQTIVDLTAEALAGPMPKMLRGRKPSEEEQARIDAYWPRVLEHCEAAGVSPGLALNKNELVQWVMDPAKPSRLTSGWREVFLGSVL